jgi:AcrR family transcriptional regulator
MSPLSYAERVLADAAPARAAPSSCRELRADARRNRDRILDAARAAFGERGLDVPLEDIADRAGVGIATLYRRFPTREALVAATFELKLDAFAEAAEQALGHPDAWAGFAGFVEWACATQAANRGVTDLLTLRLPNSELAEASRARGLRAFTALVRRAQDQGALRADFVPEDLVLLMIANAGVVLATRTAAPHAWRRLVALMIESFRAGHPGPLPAPPSSAQVEQAMYDLSRAKGICPGSAGPGSPGPGSVTPGSVSPGSVGPGSVSPGSVSPGSVSPG